LIGLTDQSAVFSVDGYKKAIELEPLNPNHWLELGKTQLMIADSTQAFTAAKDPAVVAKAKQDITTAVAEAKQAFEKSIELKANFAPAHFQLGRVFDREGKLDEAIGKFESVAKYNTSDVGVAYELGLLYLKRNGAGDVDRAKNALQQVVRLMPSHSNAHWYLASLYEKAGDKTGAIREIEFVLKLNPENQLVKTRLQKLQQSL
jgi:tetratricopeptide (TPR) repeat protein